MKKKVKSRVEEGISTQNKTTFQEIKKSQQFLPNFLNVIGDLKYLKSARSIRDLKDIFKGGF